MRMTGNDFTRMFKDMRESQEWWAEQLGISQPAVSYLFNRQEKLLPYQHAARIENLYAIFQGESEQAQTDRLRAELAALSDGLARLDSLLAWLPSQYATARAELLTISRELTAQRVMAETRLAALEETT